MTNQPTVEHSEVPTPLNDNTPNYYHYRNAQHLGGGLFECELGMGKRPRIWRLAYFRDEPEYRRLVGWYTRNWKEYHSATVLVFDDKPYPSVIQGKLLSKDNAERMLRALLVGSV